MVGWARSAAIKPTLRYRSSKPMMQSLTVNNHAGHAKPTSSSVSSCDPVPRGRRILCALGLMASVMTTAQAKPSASLGGEGSVSPILSAHFATGEGTSFVVEIDPKAPCDRALQVLLFDLSAAAPSSAVQLSWRARLVGSRVVSKTTAVPGETLRLPVPSEAFGSMRAIGALLISDSAVGDPAGAVAFTSVAVPPLDPAEPLAVPPEPGSIAVSYTHLTLPTKA